MNHRRVSPVSAEPHPHCGCRPAPNAGCSRPRPAAAEVKSRWHSLILCSTLLVTVIGSSGEEGIALPKFLRTQIALPKRDIWQVAQFCPYPEAFDEYHVLAVSWATPKRVVVFPYKLAVLHVLLICQHLCLLEPKPNATQMETVSEPREPLSCREFDRLNGLRLIPGNLRHLDARGLGSKKNNWPLESPGPMGAWSLPHSGMNHEICGVLQNLIAGSVCVRPRQNTHRHCNWWTLI